MDKRRRALRNFRHTGVDGHLKRLHCDELQRKLRGGARNARSQSPQNVRSQSPQNVRQQNVRPRNVHFDLKPQYLEPQNLDSQSVRSDSLNSESSEYVLTFTPPRPPRFPWPFYPYPDRSSSAALVKKWRPFFEQLVETRRNFDYNGHLQPSEVAQVNSFIEEFLYVTGLLEMGEVQRPAKPVFSAIAFVNKFKVTNMTKHTTVLLPYRKDVMNINLEYNKPVIVRLEYMTEGLTYVKGEQHGPNSGSIPQDISVLSHKEDFLVDRSEKERCLFVTLIRDPFCREKDVVLRVDWLGPFDRLESQERGPLPAWEKLMREEAPEVQVKAWESRKTVKQVLKERLPFLTTMLTTKKGPRHQAIIPDYERFAQDAKKTISRMVRDVNDEVPNAAEALNRYLGTLLVFNRTPNTVIYLQTLGHGTICFSTEFGTEITDNFLQVEFADVLVESRGEAVEIKREHVKVRSVDDYLEVMIRPNYHMTIELHVYWLGPRVNNLKPETYVTALDPKPYDAEKDPETDPYKLGPFQLITPVARPKKERDIEFKRRAKSTSNAIAPTRKSERMAAMEDKNVRDSDYGWSHVFENMNQETRKMQRLAQAPKRQPKRRDYEM